MEQYWWSSGWIKYVIGWVVGIPSGIVANRLYEKIKMWLRKETSYLNTSYSKGVMKFEGQYTSNVPIETLINQIVKPHPGNSSGQEPAADDSQSGHPGQGGIGGRLDTG